MSWIRDRIKSFGYAIEGIFSLFRTEPNALIHLFAAIVVVILGFVLQIRTIEWIVIIGCISAVFAVEMINTSLEYLCNAVTTKLDPNIKKAKDIAAGAVLVVAIGSAIVGIIIFYPYFVSIIF